MCSEHVRRDPYWTLAHQTTQNGTLTISDLLKSGNLKKCRTQVRSEPYMTSLSSMMIWTLTLSQNRFFLKNHDHSWTGRMIDYERCWIVLQKIQCKTLINVLDLVNIYVFDIGSICIHGKELLRQFTFHQQYKGKSHFKAKVRDIWTVDIGTIRRDFWSVSHQLRKFFMETVTSDQWWTRHQSLVYKGLCIFRFCVISRKDDSESNIKYCLGTTFGLNQRFIVIQNFGHNWRSTDGIRVEYFPGFTTLQLVQEVQKFMNKMDEPEQIQGRIIFMSMFNDIIWWNKNNDKECISNSTLVSLFAKRFPVGHWSFLELWSELKWYSTFKERSGGEWHKVAELMMIKFGESRHPVLRVRCLEERLKTKEMENYLYTSVTMRIRLKLFFAQSFLSISSVSTEQSSDLCEEYSSCQIRTGRLVLTKESNPLFASADLLIMTSTPSIEIPAQENLLQKHKERVTAR